MEGESEGGYRRGLRREVDIGWGWDGEGEYGWE